MDSDNFDLQLRRNFISREKILYKASNVSVALDILMSNNYIDKNTLVVFDLDGTIFESNASGPNRPDVLLPEIRDTFLQLYGRLRRITQLTAIITGRSEDKRQITEASLRALELHFDNEMIHFTSRGKADILRKILSGNKNIHRVIYFDDFLLHNGVYGTIQPLLHTFRAVKFIGIKVCDCAEFGFDVEEQFTEQNTADLETYLFNEEEGTIKIRFKQSVLQAVATAPISGSHPIAAATGQVPAAIQFNSFTPYKNKEEEETSLNKYLKYKTKYLQLKKNYNILI